MSFPRACREQGYGKPPCSQHWTELGTAGRRGNTWEREVQGWMFYETWLGWGKTNTCRDGGGCASLRALASCSNINEPSICLQWFPNGETGGHHHAPWALSGHWCCGGCGPLVPGGDSCLVLLLFWAAHGLCRPFRRMLHPPLTSKRQEGNLSGTVLHIPSDCSSLLFLNTASLPNHLLLLQWDLLL